MSTHRRLGRQHHMPLPAYIFSPPDGSGATTYACDRSSVPIPELAIDRREGFERVERGLCVPPPPVSSSSSSSAMAAWKDGYLDIVLIPLAVLLPAVYHLWLYRAVRRSPLSFTLGISAAARRIWVLYMMKNNEKHAVTVVQSMRNVLMGSTLVGTTSILFCTGVAAVLSSTYAVKKPLSDAVFGAHGEYMMALKYLLILSVFLLAFLCHSLAICTLNQASFLVNALSPSPHLHLAGVTRDYVAAVMERGFVLNLAGNRLFFAGAPLLLWISGPVFPCVCSMAMVPVLYNLDVVDEAGDGRSSSGGADGAVVMDGGSDDLSVVEVV